MGFFIFPRTLKPVVVPTQPPIQYLLGLYPSVGKWPGPDVDRLPQHGAEVKNEWSYTSTPLYIFMAWTETTSALFFTTNIKYIQ